MLQICIAFWKLIQPLLDPVVTAKIFFISREELPNYVNIEDMPKEVGGSDPVSYDFARSLTMSKEKLPEPKSDDQINYLSSAFSHQLGLFVERTKSIVRSINSLSDYSEESVSSLLQDITGFVQERKQIKSRLRELSVELDYWILPRNYYHRINVLNAKNGMVDWKSLEM
jgi:CRAL/TRIO domain